MDAPRLDSNQCSVLIAEYATGHVCKKDLSVYRNFEDKNEVFQIFDTEKEARQFATGLISKKPDYECVIYDHQGDHVETYDKNGIR